MDKEKSRTRLKFILGSLGLLLFALLIYRVGLKETLSNLSKIGWWFAVCCLTAFSWIFCQSLAWAIIQSAFQKVPLLTMFKAKVLADGFNTLLPAANLGGDAARAVIIKKHSPLQEGIPGVIFDKTIEYMASFIYLGGSLLISLIYLKIPESMKISSIVVLSVTSLGVAVLFFVQFKGIYKFLQKLSSFIPRTRKWFTEKEEKIRTLDANMRMLFNHSPLKLIAALTLHLISRLLGALEVLVIIMALGLPVDLIKVLFISAFVVVINTAFFIIPGQWGAAEGANLLAAVTVGYPAAAGLSIGLVRRARKLFFAALTILIVLLGKEKIKLK
ncbi:MAG: lysylphosphatidylglycerol synthase domain-containing protein [Candidatus Saccharicenans sp.]